MERLTKQTAEGAAVIDFKSLGKPFGADTVYDVVDLYHIACDRLAAYEDTELEPDEIDHLREVAEMVQGISLDRLREIVEAEKDGRLYTAHDVAVILAEATGDYCACNINGNDEWLPNFCELQDACPDTDGVACWEQYLKYRSEAEAALEKKEGKENDG